jgi:hypothetical protein
MNELKYFGKPAPYWREDSEYQAVCARCDNLYSDGCAVVEQNSNNAQTCREEHLEGALKEAADIVDGWVETNKGFGLVPKYDHLSRFAFLLRKTIEASKK